MAGHSNMYTPAFMTRPGRLRESGVDTFTVSGIQAVFTAGEFIDRRGMVSDPHASPPVRKGLLHGAGGLLRVIAVPKSGALPKLTVYAMFEGDPALVDVPVKLASYDPAAEDADGASVLELRDPPGDCRLTVLADKASVICYSHTV